VKQPVSVKTRTQDEALCKPTRFIQFNRKQ